MAKYTYKDIIIDPNSEEAKNAIGEEVYFADTPASCLNAAKNNNKAYLGNLKKLDLGDEEQPFYVNELVVSAPSSWVCIIVKKEEPKPKYVPFKSIEEFVERYTEVKEGTEFGTFEDNLLQCGMWIKSKDDDDLSQVTVIREYGICIDTMSTYVLWKNLLDDFEFIDGSPCGKLMEEKHE